jgi:cytochrome c peroxidase
VLNALDHTVSVLADDGHSNVAAVKTLAIAQDVLPAAVVAGRKLFFDATDSRMSGNRLGAACATCHIDNGQEDGHVWSFAEGRRQTMSLAGGRLTGTAPFHWDGALKDMDVLMHSTTTERMGGEGSSAEMAANVEAYLNQLPAPINPKQLVPLTPAGARGAALFEKAGCATCHSGAKLTNNLFAHVGTNEDGIPTEGLNVPSLAGVARTAPYLHDGTAASHTDRITLGKSADRHGITSTLSPDDVADLVEYLQTL